MKNTTLLWFRNDLRLSDNPALVAATKEGAVLPVYVYDDSHPLGASQRWWLSQALADLDKELDGALVIVNGSAAQELPRLAKKHAVTSMHVSRCYEPWRRKEGEAVQKALEKMGVAVTVHNGSLLWEPWTVLKSDKKPYKVFTPFFNNGCLKAESPRTPLAKPSKLSFVKNGGGDGAGALAKGVDAAHAKLLAKQWKVGEKAAKTQWKRFLARGLKGYEKGRDFPGRDSCSRLSPYLHFGHISPHQLWHDVHNKEGASRDDVKRFLTELGWREFCHSLLFFHQDLQTKNYNKDFDAFEWETNTSRFNAWKEGRTGIPMVDAGMRELSETGFMHNRVRMIVASFLTKNLLIKWQKGEEWFWDQLVDADCASNSANWQWVAGCGADAAPYFRIFNPELQAKRFDPDGDYIDRYVPELARLPRKYLFAPWKAPESVLQQAGIVLGKTYPRPIVDLKDSRVRALARYKKL